MRYIKIPETVELKDFMSEQPSGRLYEFKEFLGQMLLDVKWGKGSADIFIAADIRQKFKESGGAPGSTLELSDGEWERLAGVIREPSSPYSPVLVMQVTDYLRAILEAPSKKPD